MRGTQLVFRTPTSAKILPGGSTTRLTCAYPGGINIAPYPAIQICCANRCCSNGAVTFQFIVNNTCGPTCTLDTITLAPGECFTQTYHVPGQCLTILATTQCCPCPSAVDVFVYGCCPYVTCRNNCLF